MVRREIRTPYEFARREWWSAILSKSVVENQPPAKNSVVMEDAKGSAIQFFDRRGVSK